MNNKDIQQLLWTDYIDGTLTDQQKGIVEQYLADHHEESQRVQSYLKTNHTYIHSAIMQEAPESIWIHMQSKLDVVDEERLVNVSLDAQEVSVRSFNEISWFDQLTQFVMSPFRLASMVVVLLLMVAGLNMVEHQKLAQQDLQEQAVQFELALLAEEMINLEDDIVSDQITDIEDYFL